ncbi:MAG: rRNA large subunit methyltransferase I [Verrucomicrobia bacterium]|nr:rRNA large subunit methyltransferase I [Verrucomicrobiota bacterium]
MELMTKLILKKHCLGRIIAGHPWVFAADIRPVTDAVEDGAQVDVVDADGSFIGTGFYNSKSKIPVRILSRESTELDEVFFEQRIREAIDLRKRSGMDAEAYRVVWSEADFLPGLIIDLYGDICVIQTLTLAMDQRKAMIARVATELLKASVVVERNDVHSRQFEGLPLVKGAIQGVIEGAAKVRLGKMKASVDVLAGQKTGVYLDQIENQVEVGRHCGGRKVLDCFAYQGGFAIHAALGGASDVWAVDISEEAIAVCRKNAILNDCPKIKWKASNVFDELNTRQRGGEKFDLIILDPPSFTKSREKVEDALRGYKEINLRAFKMLEKGGMLATFCCSHHVDDESFRSIVLDASFDARRIVRLCRTFAQPADHPIIPAIPETEYLKGFLFEVV